MCVVSKGTVVAHVVVVKGVRRRRVAGRKFRLSAEVNKHSGALTPHDVDRQVYRIE